MSVNDQSQHNNLVFQMSQRESQVEQKQEQSKNQLLKYQTTNELVTQEKYLTNINPENTIETIAHETINSAQLSKVGKKNSSKLLIKQKDRYQIKGMQRGMFASQDDSINELKIIYNNNGSPLMKKQQSTSSISKRRPIKLSPLQNTSGVKIISQEQLNQKSQNYSLVNSVSLKNTRVTPIRIKDVTNMKSFVTEYISQHKKFIGILKRNRTGAKRFFPQYDLFFNQQVKYVMNSKRKCCFATSTYHIGTDKQAVDQSSNDYTATVKSNFSGSQFNVYNNSGEQFELISTIRYLNQISCKQTPRSIQVFVLSPYFKFSDLDGFESIKNLAQLYGVGNNRENKKIIKLINKKPIWDQRKQCWVLDFHGKALYSSVKNMILVNSEDEKKQAMLIAKAGNDIFNIDIMFPLSPRIAMAVVSSSFDWKWVSQ